MDKTININIAGVLFKIDEDAFRILRDYLQTINNRFRNVQGGLETIEDIESRIAEIFQSDRGQAGVISKPNVEAMISIIGKPEDFDLNAGEPESTVYTAHRKRMYRNPDDSIISGVCGGIGAYLNTDPVLFRILFILFALFFGVGFFVYIALWIALPPANIDAQKREMYGAAHYPSILQNIQPDGTYKTVPPVYPSGTNTSRIGNAFNEVFRAIGRVFFIVLRIFLIIVGVMFVLIGFLTILSFVMVFVFKFPGAFTTDGVNMNLTYFPDFLRFIVNPTLVPWIMALSSVVLILPMLALVYWGVKMIFWFKANDAVFSLAGLVLWVLAIASLAVILFSEGISFAETGKTSSRIVLGHHPDTLYIKAVNKVSDLKFDKEFSIRQEDYSVYMNEQNKELYIRPYLNVFGSEKEAARVEVRKRSAGRSKSDAMKKTEGLIYNCRLNGDTLLVDEYFTIQSGRKWSADNVGINLYIPEGSIIKFDEASENLIHSHSDYESEEAISSDSWKSGHRSWILTDEGLKLASKHSAKQK